MRGSSVPTVTWLCRFAGFAPLLIKKKVAPHPTEANPLSLSSQQNGCLFENSASDVDLTASARDPPPSGVPEPENEPPHLQE